MTLQFGHSSLTLASNRGLSCSSYRVVLVSGSSSAIVPPSSPPAAFVPPLLPLPPLSSLPQAAAPALSASAATAASALLRLNLIPTPSPRVSFRLVHVTYFRTVCR